MTDRWTGGVVDSVAPVMVVLDGDDDPTPASWVLASVTVGDQVWCQVHGRQVVVLGKNV